MAQFQLLRCAVALGGDTGNVVVRHRGRPILCPELMVLQFLHGEESVTDVHVVGTCEMAQDEALTRLRLLYGPEAVEKVFPGSRPRLPFGDASVPLCTQRVHKLKPTRPDNPDPQLRPLDQYTIANAEPVEDVDAMPGFDKPEPYSEEDDIEAALRESDVSQRPKIEDQPQTRTGFRGQARQARQTPSALPDVSGGRPKQPGDHDHDRPKG